MKTLFTFFSALFLAFSLSAQTSHSIENAYPRTAKRTLATNKTQVVDTIFDYFNRSTNFYFLTAGTAGYVLGTNNFTEETAVHYDGIGVLKVSEIAVFVTYKDIVGTADSLVARAYSVGNDTLPTGTLGEGKVSMNDVDTTGFATFIPLNIQDSTTGAFMVSIDYDEMDDSVAILSNNVFNANGGPDGNGEDRTRQKLNGNTWLPVSAIWDFSGIPMDADALILPVIDYTELVSVVPAVDKGMFSVSAPFPQPAQDLVTLPYSLRAPAQVSVTLYDAQGRPVSEFAPRKVLAGDQEWTIATESFSAGIYYFHLATDFGSLMGKFIIQ